MKLFHLADLHIGKIVNGFSMIDEQKTILDTIYKTALAEKADGIIMAGDIYDKAIPSTEAIAAFDKFITNFSNSDIPCYIVSGNHDSVQRVSFGASVMEKHHIYFAKTYSGYINPITINEQDVGTVNIWLLPFVRPADVRPYHEKENIECGNYNDAIKAIISNLHIDKKCKNILVAHQFITSNGVSPLRCESETSSLGTLDNVDASVFKDFDYVALGHLHGSQCIGNENIRYAGSPLKYSFSEVDHKKSITVLNITKKGITYDEIPLVPQRDLKEIRGKYDDLIKGGSEDYMHITLTDNFIPDVKRKLETRYPYIMQLDYDNVATREDREMEAVRNVKNKSVAEHFADFYELQNNEKPNKTQTSIINEVIEEIGGIL